MARLLVMRRDFGPGKHEVGDIVVAKPDNHVFGRLEDLSVWLAEGRPAGQFPGHFYIIDVPGLSAAVVNTYLEAEVDVPDQNDPSVLRSPRVLRRRNWKLNVPPAIRTQLDTTFQATVTQAALLSAVVRKANLHNIRLTSTGTVL